jgi:DNA-binding response OmpR family regulator
MKRVLIVEDEAIVQLEIKEYLERLGHRAFGALTVEAAMELVNNESLDVACVDIMLKRDSEGIELAKRLKRDHGIPVVFVTGNSDEPTRAAAMKVSPVAYLVKPLHLPALEAVIQEIDNKDAQ